MAKIRYLLTATLIAVTLFSACAYSQSTLTQILDTIQNPDGSPFTGTVTVNLVTPSGAGGGVSRVATTARVYNGTLSLLLLPTTTSTAGTYYQVVYVSSDATVTWTETWQVPPSATPLTVSAVRVTSTGGSDGGSGSGSTSGTQYATLPISISSVTGLGSTLGSLTGSINSLQSTTSGLSSQITGVGNSVTSLGNTVTGLNTTVTGLNTTVGTQGSTLSTLNSTVGALNTTVTGLSTLANSTHTDLSSLQTTVTTQGNTLSALNSSVSGLTSTVTTQGGTLSTLSTTVGTQGTTLGGLNTTVSGLNTAVGGHTTSIATLTNSLSNLNTAVTGNTTSIGDVTSNVTGLSTSVTNLTSQLNGINATINTLSAAGSTAVFVDAETPVGTVNGTNPTFSLANTPGPSTSLSVFVNGMLAPPGTAYALNGSSITFTAGSIPALGAKVLAFYRVPGTGAAMSFVDNETPAGSVNGTNVIFTLATAPNPTASLRLYRNGLLLATPGDFTVSGSTITITSAAPQPGDSLSADYRH